MKKCVTVIAALLPGLLVGGNVLANDVVILECGLTYGPEQRDPNCPDPDPAVCSPFRTADPGVNIVLSSSSSSPPPTNLEARQSCTNALHDLGVLRYKLKDVQPSSWGGIVRQKVFDGTDPGIVHVIYTLFKR